MMKPARYLTLCALVALPGCEPATGPDLSGSCFFMCAGEWEPGGNPSTLFAVSPQSARILRGDTVTLFTQRCGDPYCGVQTSENSNWTIAGAAVVALVDGFTTRTVPATDAIVVRGEVSGRSDVTATSAINSSLSRTAHVDVADSSAIAALRVFTFVRDSVQSGHYEVVYVHGLDTIGDRYTVRPTEWSVSDTSVLELGSIGTMPDGTVRRYVTGKKAGTVELTARFLDVTRILKLTVVP